MPVNRRTFLSRMLAGSAFGAVGVNGFLRQAIAMGTREYPQGMQKIQGIVQINGAPATIGTPVKAGDTVSSGPDSMAIFVIGKEVYLIRDNTEIKLDGESSGQFKETLITILKILNGKMLSVFKNSQKRIMTRTAVVGIRGTGYYVEATVDRTYFCTCYGSAVIASASAQEKKETVKTRHHEAPRYIYAEGADKWITPAPVVNHSDAELILIESMVGRKPPFLGKKDHRY